MKILIVNVFFAPDTFGGATIVAEQVAHNLSTDFGHKVYAFSTCSNPELGGNQLLKTFGQGITNFQININDNSYHERYVGDNKTTLAFEKVLKYVNPDIVHIHCIQGIGASILEICRKYDKRTVLTLHDFWWICERQFMINTKRVFCGQFPIDLENCVGCMNNKQLSTERFKYLTDKLREADVITAPSDYTKRLYEGTIAGLEVLVVKNGVVPPSASYQRNTPENKTVYGFLGGPGSIKGFNHIVEAVKDLKKSDSIFRIVDASLDSKWYKDFDSTSLPGAWEIVPRFSQNEIDTFYSSIDILLFPSQWKETFGLSVREALIRDVWVIATNGGGAVEDCTEGINSNLIGYSPYTTKQLLELFEVYDHKKPDNRYNTQITTFADQAAEFDLIYKDLQK